MSISTILLSATSLAVASLAYSDENTNQTPQYSSSRQIPLLSATPKPSNNNMAPAPAPAASQGMSREVLVEGKISYFHPTNHKFQKVFKSGGALYGLEISGEAWRDLYVWASGSYFQASGHSLGIRYSTHAYFIPLALGLKYLHYVNDNVGLYGAFGGVATYGHIHNRSPFVHNVEKWGGGWIAKAGVIADLNKRFFLDFFADYSSQKINNHDSHGGKVVPHNVDLSGWSVGGAIGYRFGGNSKRS